MRNTTLCLAILLPVLAPSLLAQKRDFLTPFETDQLREVQNPNGRLQLYSTWAKQRVAEIEKIAADPKPGRATFVHDLLEDYTHIIEAADMVADDALRRKMTIEEGIGTYAGAEKDLLTRLEKLRDSKPKDFARFEFVLREAIETTEDSLDLNQQDLGARASAVAAKDKKEQRERLANMTPEERKEKNVEEYKEATQKRKAPTLRRPGETLPGSSPNK
jgi:hypothetical protein